MSVALRPRIVVVQPEGADTEPVPWIDVGVTRFPNPLTPLAFVVKATFRYRPDRERVDESGAIQMKRTTEGLPLSVGQMSTLPGASAHDVYYPSDFVPRKHALDVLVAGHAHAPLPSSVIVGRVEAPGMVRTFQARSQQPARAIPLTRESLSPNPYTPALPIGPSSIRAEDPSLESDDDEIPEGHYNVAAEQQRVPDLAPDAVITLVGLSPLQEVLRVALPGLQPVAILEHHFAGEMELEMKLDTLWFESDSHTAVLVWRAFIQAGHVSDLRRLVVALEPAEAPRDAVAIMPSLQRGQFGFAVRAGDLLGEEDPPDEFDKDRLEQARYETWAAPAPEPKIPLEEYATIAAEVAEDPKQRNDILKAHDYDDASWTIEERGWLERMATSAMNGDAKLATEYGEAFVRAQDALAKPHEADRTVADYARIKVRMERTDDPSKEFEEQNITLAEWLRMDRRFARLAEEDRDKAVEIDKAVREERMRQEQLADDDIVDEATEAT